MSCQIIAIDPGVGGGIAYETTQGGCEVVSMPKTRREIFEFIKSISIGDAVVVIERAQMMPTDGKKTARVFGNNYECLLTCVEILGVPYASFHPATWQSKMNLLKRRKKGEPKETQTERKNRLKARAIELHPSKKVTLKTADALLILSFAMQEIKADRVWFETNADLPKQKPSLF